eukprot:TRINITY_DN8197_c1_g1_i2.p1 TRINITY_DN8197_c1_g1~~TRINITY_DN8197_c1_g1_i2.p1  ORF type:complete len:591 (+),score=144.57 TRINITY_DN8197_c1_g1_i2:60-1832(+)
MNHPSDALALSREQIGLPYPSSSLIGAQPRSHTGTDEDGGQVKVKVVTYPGFSSTAPRPLPVRGEESRRADTRLVMEQTLRCNRQSLSSGLGRLLLGKGALDLVCDTFWWVFLRYFVMVDLRTLAETHKRLQQDSDGPTPATMDVITVSGSSAFPTLSAASREGSMPLHIYGAGMSASTRPLSVLSLSAAPGTLQAGAALEGISSRSQSPGSSSRRSRSSSSSELWTPSTSGSPGSRLSVAPPDISALPRLQREEFVEEEERLLYDRIADRYLRIARRIARVRPATSQDLYYTQCPDIVAQAVWLALHRSMPYAHAMIGIPFQKQLLGLVTFWMTGVERTNVARWQVRIDGASVSRGWKTAPRARLPRVPARPPRSAGRRPAPPPGTPGQRPGTDPGKVRLLAPAPPVASSDAPAAPRKSIACLRNLAGVAGRSALVMQAARERGRTKLRGELQDLGGELAAVHSKSRRPPEQQQQPRGRRLSTSPTTDSSAITAALKAAMIIGGEGGARGKGPLPPSARRPRSKSRSRRARRIQYGDKRSRPARVQRHLDALQRKSRGSAPWYETVGYLLPPPSHSPRGGCGRCCLRRT